MARLRDRLTSLSQPRYLAWRALPLGRRDLRFARLRIRTLVMEWHRTRERPDGKTWCEQTLEALGHEVTPGLWSGEVNGLLWARPRESEARR